MITKIRYPTSRLPSIKETSPEECMKNSRHWNASSAVAKDIAPNAIKCPKKTHYFENKEIGSEMDEAFEME